MNNLIFDKLKDRSQISEIREFSQYKSIRGTT